MNDAPRQEDIDGCLHLKNLPIGFLPDTSIGILIGMNQPDLLFPIETVRGPNSQPYATLHLLGYALNGLVANRSSRNSLTVNRITVEGAEEIKEKIDVLYAQEFVDPDSGVTSPSAEDCHWLNLVSSTIKLTLDGHFQIALPFREVIKNLPNNREQVKGRALSLRRKFQRNEEFKREYVGFMNDLQRRGYMTKVLDNQLMNSPGRVWYLTHHAVFHHQKKKIRVVLDCSLKFKGFSQNDRLLQGPDLTNNLIGILLRFRQHQYAISADIKKMFLQVKVPPEDADLQRILWFPDGDTDQELCEYRLNTHVFGATSSPSCANFALRHTTTLSTDAYSLEAKEAIKKDFYVDDFLKSMTSEHEMKMLIHKVQSLLGEGGFNLTGFYSNSRGVLSSLPQEHLAKGWHELDFRHDELPKERALGVIWKVENDGLGFRVELHKKENTRRGLLSSVASVYDPLGLAAPVVLVAKLLFQKSCEHGSWDDPLEETVSEQWTAWMKGMQQLDGYSVPRCFGPIGESQPIISLHLFCDGSEKAFGAVAYARWQQLDGEFHTCLMMAKTRLVPQKASVVKTIARIELNAAKLAVQLYLILKRELTLKIEDVIFWSDSSTVLAYLSNKTSRYQCYVAHRVEFICGHKENSQWRYVPSNENVADILTKECGPLQFVEERRWKYGPSFLGMAECNWPNNLGLIIAPP